jgi:hypothetical protein
MTYSYISIVGVSMRDYVSNFQVAVVLILRASSDFLLHLFPDARKQHSGGHLSASNLGTVFGSGGWEKAVVLPPSWGDEAIFDRRKAFTMKGVSLHCKYMVNELTGKPDTDSSVRQAIISLARDTVPSSGRNLTKAGRKIRFVGPSASGNIMVDSVPRSGNQSHLVILRLYHEARQVLISDLSLDIGIDNDSLGDGTVQSSLRHRCHAAAQRIGTDIFVLISNRLRRRLS